MAESKIKKKIVERLKKRGWEVNLIIACSKPGWPDVECFKNKRTVFIETKDVGKDARALQDYRHEKLRKQGFEVIIGKSLKDIEHL